MKIFYQKMASLRPDQIEKMLLFVGYEDQTPVATACLFFTDVAGIYDISTKSEKRGHGYGSSMFHRMLDYARKMGYKTAILQASIEGINIYKRFGFEQVCKFNVWSKKF